MTMWAAISGSSERVTGSLVVLDLRCVAQQDPLPSGPRYPHRLCIPGFFVS